jgi:hypothetical protein
MKRRLNVAVAVAVEYSEQSVIVAVVASIVVMANEIVYSLYYRLNEIVIDDNGCVHVDDE